MKFKHLDARYLERRRALSDELGPRPVWEVADHWPLYAGVSNIARFMAIADLLRSTLGVPGHVAEFGSWRGANLSFLTKLLAIYDPHGPKVVHCFDSFEGLTDFAPEDGAARDSAGAYRGARAELEAMLDLVELSDAVEIHEGLIQDTLPPLCEARPGLSFSFVYCDTDLYEPSKLILEHLDARLAPGGLFVFDQWNYDAWPGESLAVREFLESRPGAYRPETPPNARQPSLALRKL